MRGNVIQHIRRISWGSSAAALSAGHPASWRSGEGLGQHLHSAASALAAQKGPSLGEMPISDLSKTGSGGPGSGNHASPDEETRETFRSGIIDSMAKEMAGKHVATDATPKADRPIHKYQEAYVEGREDDTATAGMPEERPVATPSGGLGNTPGHNEPEPPRGGQGGLDSVPNEAGASPHPSNEDGVTRARWGPEEDAPLIRKTGKPEVDATTEPGTTPDVRGSTDAYNTPATKKTPYKNPLG